MLKEFFTCTIRNKPELIKLGDELCEKGKQAIELYRQVANVIDEVNGWPHPMWCLQTFKAWTFLKGQQLYIKYEGTPFLESFKEVWEEISLVNNLTSQQTLFFLFHRMELNQISNLGNHVWKVDEEGFPSVEIETPQKPKMSFFMVQDLEKENQRLKAELKALKGV